MRPTNHSTNEKRNHLRSDKKNAAEKRAAAEEEEEKKIAIQRTNHRMYVVILSPPPFLHMRRVECPCATYSNVELCKIRANGHLNNKIYTTTAKKVVKKAEHKPFLLNVVQCVQTELKKETKENFEPNMCAAAATAEKIQ